MSSLPWWSRVRTWARRALERTFVENPAQWLVEMFGGRASGTGVVVTPTTAMQSTAVLACVRVLAEGEASLPFKVYRRTEDGGKEADPEHPVYAVLHDQFNPEQTAFEGREMLQGHLALRGNAYAEIVRDGAGRLTALWPLHPDGMRIARAPDGALVYWVRVPGGLARQTGQAEVPLSADRVLHLRGLSSDGVLGLSPIQMAREAIGLALAVEEYGARFFGQGSMPAGVLEHPARVTTEQLKNIRDSWESIHAGLSGAHRIAILEQGMKWQQLGLQNDHAQFLQTRQFQVPEIARVFRVQPHKIGDLTHATFSNIEHQAIEHVVDTLRPWLVRWEQGCNAKLLTPQERRSHFCEHVVDGLLRGDIASRYAAYAIGRQWGWLSADDIRGFENMNALPNGQGKTYLIPLNMVPADQPMPAPPEPKPDEDDDEDEEDMEDMQAGMRAALRSLLVDAAQSTVRRELEKVRRAAVQHAADPKAWREWVHGFYREHEAHLVKTLRLAPAQAEAYAAERRRMLISDGVTILDTWGAEGAEPLVALALAALGPRRVSA